MRRTHRWNATIRTIAAVLATGLILLLIFHSPILAWIAGVWKIEDSDQVADVVIVLGGQIATRPSGAARIYLEGRASRVFVMREAENPLLHADTPGGERSLHVAKILEEAGVPSNVIFFSTDRVNSTWEEAGQFAQWRESLEETEPPVSAIIVTNDFHTRRALWAFNRRNSDRDLKCFVTPLPNPKYRTNRWWQSEHGRQDFASEIKKYIYYRIRY